MRLSVIITLLVLLFALAALALILFAPRFNYDVVIELPTRAAGPSGAFVGVGDPGEEVGIECPVGIEFLTGHELALVDSATRRILTTDVAARRFVSAGAINLEPTVFPVAAVFEEGRLWLWAQSASGDIQLPAGFARDGAEWFRSPDLPQAGNRLLERFRDLGLSPPQAASVGIAPDQPNVTASSSASDTYQPSPSFDWTEVVPGENGRGATARFQTSGTTLRLVARAANGTETAVDVRAPRQVLIAHALGVGPAGETYFTVQNWDPNTADFDIREEVRRTDALDTVYDVPLAESDCVSKQHVAVSPSGEIYALRVQERSVAILRLKPRTFAAKARAWLEAQGFDLPRLNVQDVLGVVGAAKAQILQSGGAISRRDVVANACSYLRETWSATAGHLAAPPGTCACRSGSCNRQYTPATDMVVVGQQISGVPYNWGGADRLVDFRRKVGVDGRPGGNVCTNGDKGILRSGTDATGIHPAGVDCSGFVTRALGYPGAGHPHTTRTIATIADPVAKLDMRPGDLANKAGNHVRMLLNWRRPANGAPWDSIEMIESTTEWDGVGRKIRAFVELSGGGSRGGYVMLRPDRIAETAAPLDRDLITCRAP
jgi:cell wall-associated NlpC family hydrolase